jgi:hypothetical protein
VSVDALAEIERAQFLEIQHQSNTFAWLNKRRRHAGYAPRSIFGFARHIPTVPPASLCHIAPPSLAYTLLSRGNRTRSKGVRLQHRI